MSEHQMAKWEMALAKPFGNIYNFNLALLMLFTVIEVGAVYMDLPKYETWAVLVGVGLVKAFGIAAWFMHLRGDPVIITRTAIFPFFFVVLMLWGIGLTNPAGVENLPSWCTPPWVPAYGA